MPIRSYKKVYSPDSSLMSTQDSIEEFSKQLTNIPLLDGVLLEGEDLLSAGDTTVYHGLQRAYRGYLIVKKDANAVVYESDTDNESKKEKIILKCSANVTVSIWVF